MLFFGRFNYSHLKGEPVKIFVPSEKLPAMDKQNSQL